MATESTVLKNRSRDGSSVSEIVVGELLEVNGRRFEGDAAEARLHKMESKLDLLVSLLVEHDDPEAEGE